MKQILLIIALATVSTLSICAKEAESGKVETIQKWEYEVVYATFDADLSKAPSDFVKAKEWLASEVKKKFNAMGAKGWELVSYDRKSDMAVFKRKVKRDR